MDPTIVVVDGPEALEGTIAAARQADRVAVDTEGNGLFAYRARLCTVQLGWQDNGRQHVAIIDTLAVPVTPLAALLHSTGPTKLLHDMTFDVRMLQEAGVALGAVEDTSVMARMLGRKATGLAALLASELGVEASKGLQQHNWSQRPFTPEQIRYLATDVAYLDALASKLMSDVRELDIEDEVREECAFKLATSLGPPREKGGSFARMRGVDALDVEQQAHLLALMEARERVAARIDQPPFKVVASDLLLEIARKRARTEAGLEVIRLPCSERARKLVLDVWGLAGSVAQAASLPPLAAPLPDAARLALRRARQRRLSAWRRAEAQSRGVDEQVVLPGHCLQDLCGIEAPSMDAVTRVPGLGQRRLTRYGATMLALLLEVDAR